MSGNDIQASLTYTSFQETFSKSSQKGQRVLCEIKDLNGFIGEVISKKREQSVRSGESSIKKAPIRGSSNKQNFKEIDDNVLKMISYGNMNRSIEEKMAIIDRQKQEIAALKECVNNIRYNGTVKEKEQAKLKEEREKAREDEMRSLRQQQREHSQTLKQLQGMRGHIKQIKKKYDCVVNQKQSVLEKYNRLLGQNQELTLVISKLKQQQSIGGCNEYVLNLQQELSMVRLDLKQSQNQRESSESRCNNFEKRMNEYILKYNEMHSNFGQFQIKYYKMQKDCDNLKVDRDQLELKANNSVNQLTAEREIHQKQMILMKGKLKRYEEQILQKETVLLQLRKTDNEDEATLLQLNDTVKRLQEENKILRQQNELETKKWQKYVKELMRQCSQQREQKLNKCKHQLCQLLTQSHQQNVLLKQQHQRYVITITHQVQQLSESLIQTKQQNALMEEQLKRNQQIIYQSNFQSQQSKRKCEYYISEISLRNNLIKEKETEIQTLEADIQQHLKQQQQILTKIDQLQKQINDSKKNLNQQNQILLSQNQTIKQQFTEKTKYFQQKQKNYDRQIQKILKEKEEAISCLRQYRQHNLVIDSEKQQFKKLREQQTKQKRYYQQKYQRQLQQYNQLSLHFRQLQSQNDRLLKQNANNIVQISNLRGDLLQLKSEIANYSYSLSQSDIIQQKTNSFQSKYYQSQNKCNLYLQKIEQLDHCLTDVRKQIQTLRQTHNTLNNKYQTVLNRNQQLDSLFKSQENKVTISTQLAQNIKSNQTTDLTNLQNRLRLTEEELYAATRTLSEKDILIAKIKTQLELQVQEIRYLTQSVNAAQGKYASLVQQYNIDAAEWDQLKQRWRQYAEARQAEKKMMHNSRISANYELDSSQNAIEILRQQNRQLQRIFGVQIERRNSTIRELIKQKKALFSQLIEKNR